LSGTMSNLWFLIQQLNLNYL